MPLTKAGCIGNVNSTPKPSPDGITATMLNPKQNIIIWSKTLDENVNSVYDAIPKETVAIGISVCISRLYAAVLSRIIPEIKVPRTPLAIVLSPIIATSRGDCPKGLKKLLRKLPIEK